VGKPSSRRLLLVVAAGLAMLALAGTASAARYVVVFKEGRTAAGVAAVKAAGGKVVSVNRLGIATVRGPAALQQALGRSGAVADVARDAYWKQRRPAVVRALAQFPGVGAQATGCANQYQPPGGTGVGPDPLSVCQWDMRMINASPTGSYAVNRGEGASVGIIDTGIDGTHADIVANLDTTRSCSFIKPGNPAAEPQEIAPTGRACGPAAQIQWQDYSGHGTHVAGTVAAPINGIGVAGTAPEATLVALKAGTALGWFFTSEVVDAITYAGEQRLDVVNMSFFADPFLFNCRNDAEQRAIVKAISRATQYAHKRGVVLVAAAGNEAADLDHPTTDELSPDWPPGAEVPREVGNECVVLPQELPWVATISAVGPQKVLSFYSTYGNSKIDVTAPGGDSTQAPNPFGRVLNTWSSTAPFTAGGNPTRTVEDCPSGPGVCFYYAWIQGTSMASPHAAGVAALIRSAHPGMPPTAVEARMQHTAMRMDCPPDPRCTGGGQTNFYGNGLVDALAAGTS